MMFNVCLWVYVIPGTIPVLHNSNNNNNNNIINNKNKGWNTISDGTKR